MKHLILAAFIVTAIALIGCSQQTTAPSERQTINVVPNTPIVADDTQSGTLVKLDYESLKGVFVSGKGDAIEFYANFETKITRDGVEDKFESLLPGNRVGIEFAKDNYAVSITVKGKEGFAEKEKHEL
jgi:hypothetical protein